MENTSIINSAEPQKIVDAEFCFQFDNDEPFVFAWSNESLNDEDSPHELTFSLKALEGTNIVFHSNNKEFKIFARPITEESKKLRKEQKEKISV